MAMEIIDFITNIGQFLWVPLGRRIGYLLHYKSNIDTLNVEVEKLDATRHDNQVLIDEAKMNGEEIYSVVQIWVTGADTAITKAERLSDEAKVKKKCLWWCQCPDLRSRYKLSKQAVESTKSIRELQMEGGFDKVSQQVRQPIEIQSMLSGEEFEAFESTKQAMDEVMEALKDGKVKIVGVYGKGGVGKTTMVKQVGVQAHKDRLFDHVIMASVSQNPDLIRIQGQLADMLALKLDEETEFGRAGRLKERIMGTKKILIVLDDLWERIELSEIGIPSGNDLLEVCRSKILITTRKKNICFAMGCQRKIHLNVLSEQDSWTLFRSKAGEVVDDPNFSAVARKVAKECGGLPYSLSVVAKALGDKDLEEWEEASRQLEMSRITNLDDEESIFKYIKLNYI